MTLFFSVLLAASALTPVRDSKRGFAFTPPEGYVQAPDLAPGTHHAWARGTVGSESYGVLTVTGLGGTLGEDFALDRAVVEKSAREAAGRSGVTMTRFDYRTARWRGLQLDVVVSWASGNGQQLVSFATQVPLEPEAMQVVMFGPANSEAQLGRELDAVLASFEGKTSWGGKRGRDETLGRTVGVAAGIGAGVALGLLARRFFRRR